MGTINKSKEKEEVIKRLSKMNLPVSDCEFMKEEIIFGALGKKKMLNNF